MKYALIALILICGCSSKEEIAKEAERGELRHTLFVECMELSSKNPRMSDDDVHKIVDSCSQQSWYMANQMKP